METVVVVGSTQAFCDFVARLDPRCLEYIRLNHLRQGKDFMGYNRGVTAVFLDEWQYSFRPEHSRQLLDECRVREMRVLSEKEFVKIVGVKYATSTPKRNNLLLLL